jgi:hypothetical protein
MGAVSGRQQKIAMASPKETILRFSGLEVSVTRPGDDIKEV